MLISTYRLSIWLLGVATLPSGGFERIIALSNQLR